MPVTQSGINSHFSVTSDRRNTTLELSSNFLEKSKEVIVGADSETDWKLVKEAEFA